MRTALFIVLILCVASVSLSLARRHHKKHHRRHWPRVGGQAPQPNYEPDVFYESPVSSDDYQNSNDGWQDSADWTNSAPAIDDGWSNVEQVAPVDDGWSNPAVEQPAPVNIVSEKPQSVGSAPVDPGFENPEIVDPVPVDQGFENSEIVDPGFENPELVDPVPVEDAWGKEEVDQNAWVEEREQPEPVEDPSEVDWQEAQGERKPWFDDQVEIRHEKVPSPPQEDYDEGFEEEPEDAIDGMDIVGVDSFENGEIIDDISEEDIWENPDLDEGLDMNEEFYGSNSETSEETSEEMYEGDSESQGYSSEEDFYGKRDGHDDWNSREEDDNDAGEDEEVDNWWDFATTTTPSVIGEPDAYQVLGQRWRTFAAWHYAVFAIAGAVFLVGFMIIMVTAIRACRYRKPSYRRLEAPAAV